VRSTVRSCLSCVGIMILLVSVSGYQDLAWAERGEEATQLKLVEFGITMSLTGNFVRAESAFVSVLSLVTMDPRALTNLGNLHLIRGEPETALVFYDQAHLSDSTDAGILLNRSIAHMLMGDEVRARRDAASALRLSGGLANANALLGLRNLAPQEKPAKGAESPYLSPDEVQALLMAAASSVPGDSTIPGDSDSLGVPPGSTAGGAGGPSTSVKRPSTWRPAGLRAADQQNIATILYWKR
jgi:hypothetical protein